MFSEQIEEYLEALGKMEERGERITTTSLARERRVTAPSVTEMLGRLSDRGLVSYKPRGEILLTEEGRTVARSVMRRHRLWERFLHDVLGLRWDRVHGEACKLEHATSAEVELELARALGGITTCPHGHSIPSPDGTISAPPAVPLLDLPPCELGRVVSVREDDPDVLRDLEKMGLKPGVLVLRSIPESGADGVALKVGNVACSLPAGVAEGIRVAPTSPEEMAPTISLAQLSPGETGLVTRLAAGKSLVTRCLALGFTPGTPVTVIRNPKSGPLLVSVRETRVALGQGEAQKIQVVRSSLDGDGSRSTREQ